MSDIRVLPTYERGMRRPDGECRTCSRSTNAIFMARLQSESARRIVAGREKAVQQSFRVTPGVRDMLELGTGKRRYRFSESGDRRNYEADFLRRLFKKSRAS